MGISIKRFYDDGPVLIMPDVYEDGRGAFIEAFKESSFVANNINFRPVQVNHSFSVKNVLRGLHYQLNPYAQAKLVYVVRGVVWDVSVDLRRNSPTYKKWTGVLLSGENRHQFYMPEGFAHGFYVLSDAADVVYLVNNEYNRESDRTVLWSDMNIGIEWPEGEKILSDKDKFAPNLNEAENNF